MHSLFKKITGDNPVTSRYVADGLLAASAVNIANNNYSLFAVRLGASDFQLSLVNFLPHIFTLLVLIPGGLLMDSLHNKKRIVIVMMIAVMFGYLLCAISPFAASKSIQFFLGSLALAGTAVALYNIAWQSFFPGVVSLEKRNHVLTLRTRVTLFVSMITPVLVGLVLTNILTVDNKIIAHQSFFACALLLFFFAALNFRKFKPALPAKLPAAQQTEPARVTLAGFKKAGTHLLHNKPFILFTITALFFYMTWHFDWTLYFIGQVNYLKMNEFQIGLVHLGAAAIQLLTLKFWSRNNEKHGVVLPFTFGILGLSLCPVIMIVSVSLSMPSVPYLFIVLHTIAHIPFCVITLNIFQCVLLVTENENRSFYISVFTSLICLSNAVMPVAGVALYHLLGVNIDGFRYTFAVIFILRIIAALLWLLWWKKTR